MFGWLVTKSLGNRLIVLVAAAIVSIYGLLTIPIVPVDIFPDLDKPLVTVMTEAEGLAPQEVEQLVTIPIESSMNGIPGVTRVRSTSGVGLSIVNVEFGWASDIYRSRQLVAERLATIGSRLPQRITPQIGPVTSIMGEVMLIALTSETAAPMDMRTLADFTVRPQLLNIPGVAQVIPMGGEVRQFRIAPNLAAMQAIEVTAAEIEAAVRRFGENTGGGYIDQYSREFLVRNVGLTNKLEDLRNLVVATRQGQGITLRQVASVDFAAKVKRGDSGYQGKPAVIISVQKQPGSDTLALTERIEAALETIQKTMPEGISVKNVQFRQASFIEQSIANLKSALVEATAVVALLLFLFLLNWRATLISLLAIPISILITIVVFKAFGLTINTMTLGGLAIAIGELVDDAVVDVENILRRLRENRVAARPRPLLSVIAAASQEVRSGIIYATLIVILVFVPLFALSGIEGRLFSPLGIAYIISILGSLVASITVTPVLASLLFKSYAEREHTDSALVRTLKAVNRRALDLAFNAPAIVIGLVAAAVLIAGVVAAGLPRAFLPPFNEGTLTINLLYNPGISLKESDRLGLLAEQTLMGVPEVLSVGRRTGRAELDEHAEGVHSSEIDVDLKKSTRSKADIVSDIRRRLSIFPASINVGQPISHRLDHLLSGVRAEVALKIYGDDLDTLRTLAETLRGKLSAISGLSDLQVEKQVPIPEVRIAVDYQRAALYGLTAAYVTEALDSLASGRVVSQIVDGPKRFDVVLRLSEADRSTSGLGDLLISSPGGMIPLRLIADVEETEGPNQIQRENTRRRIVVLANTDGKADMATVIAEVRSILAATPLPAGYTAALEGTFQAQEEASRKIAALALVSLALIFAVLFTRYRSTVLALIVIVNIPLALIGSIAALTLAGQPLSVASMIGFITLAGIATRNGILKISHYINLALNEGLPFGRQLVIRGSLERMTPVLMTALAAGLALLPLLYGADRPGREILHPVAVTIFGGLVSSTFLDTFLTPLLFLLFGEKPLERLRAAKSAAEEPQGTVAAAY